MRRKPTSAWDSALLAGHARRKRPVARNAVVCSRARRELGKKARAYAVPSGGALVIGPDGTVRARGEPVPVFAALPNRKANIEETLVAGP